MYDLQVGDVVELHTAAPPISGGVVVGFIDTPNFGRLPLVDWLDGGESPGEPEDPAELSVIGWTECGP